jgi:hypothetical protein
LAYTTEDIEQRAETLMGESLDAAKKARLNALCSAAAGEVTARLREGVTPESAGESFITAAGMLALAMYMELGDAAEDFSSFRAGNVSVTRRRSAASAARLRQQAEELLREYISDSGFSFMGVRG